MSHNAFSSIRHHFNDLASEDGEVRLTASSAILSGLTDAPNPDIEKALDRLLKGLASGRKSARVGFSVTLTELLARLWGPPHQQQTERDDISLEHILKLLQQHTVPRGKVTGQEERDNLFGRLFGLESILKAGILCHPDISEAEREQVLDLVYQLATDKPWLREECGWIICRAIQSAEADDDQTPFARVAIERLCGNKLALSPEGVAIWLATRSAYPGIAFPKVPWPHQDPLHADSTHELAKVLKESPIRTEDAEGEDQGPQRGMWSSNPHFVWDLLFDIFYQSPSPRTAAPGSKRGSFEDFWRHSVDDALFSASASKERKYWGFMLFSKVFEEGPSSHIPTIFSENMIRCLTNQLSDGDRYLHRTALRVLKVVHSKVEAEPPMALPAIAGFTRNGTYDFDQATKTKTISRLYADADNNTLGHVVEMISLAICKLGDVDSKAVEPRRQILASQLVVALRNKAPDEESDTCIGNLLNTLATFAYPPLNSPDHAPTPAISTSSRSMFQTRLSSCFAHLLSSKNTTKHDWPYRVLSFLNKHESLVESTVMSNQVAEDVKTAMERLDQLNEMEPSKRDKRKAHVRAFKLLYALVVFQVKNGDTDGLTVLSELDDCFERIFRKSEGLKDASSEVLVEVLLSLASKRSVLLRKLSQQVFPAFAGDIGAAGLQLLFDVLATKETLAGQQSLFDQENEEDAEDDDENMPDVNGNSAGSDTSQDESSDGSSEAEDSAVSGDASDVEVEDFDGEGNEEELARLNKALAPIVGTRPFGEGDAALEEASSSDEAMDDDEMFALDGQMANVFKERRKVTSKKQEKRDAKETIVNFKNRVLDLLDIYIKQQHQNKLVLNLVLPLLVLSRTSTSKQITDRACGLIRELAQKCKGKELPQPKKSRHVWEMLDEVHEEAMQEASRAHATACSQSSLVLVKVLVRTNAENIERVVMRYATTHVQWLKGKHRVQPLIFSDFLNWSTSYSKQHQ